MTNWDRLAAWENDCPCLTSDALSLCYDCTVNGGHSHDCRRCLEGTGKVAVLPLLRHYCKPIAGAEGFHWSREGFPTHDATDGCPGWQAVPRSEEALELALMDVGLDFEIRYFSADFPDRCCGATFWNRDGQPIRASAAKPFDALEAAAVKMMEAQQ